MVGVAHGDVTIKNSIDVIRNLTWPYSIVDGIASARHEPDHDKDAQREDSWIHRRCDRAPIRTANSAAVL